ncbi:PREDICTED: inositol-trisphosphate 3-kinase A-like isoform X2 [Amphimedon queenslandica]|uniref:Kinase n=1 Tax=Amphimedon queenslandica TaxID=400682 RepID=A0AAN0J4R0_AMPQE|nr:PREDICTED: inositol-trisphosphate 3-kinase A-like isoform X2 [Amphimedon queenslandica]|eukprot:XP_019851731.1 PREDICTED: inositol-trisphosphate 3-kinase A-like isoform X2 [Amphimedon queenslandica]
MATGTDRPRSPLGKKKKDMKGSLVMASLAQTLDSTMSVALREPAPPVNTKSLRLPELLAPKPSSSRRHYSYSDDDTPSPTSPTRTVRWAPHSPIFSRKKKNRPRALNERIKSASSSPVLDGDSISSNSSADDAKHKDSVPILRPEATQVDSLPGQLKPPTSSFPCTVPTILVSPDQEDCGGIFRKTSQSSHLSAASSTITSGAALSVGSLLSPSGDEESCISDQESPLSPLSNASSITGSREFVCHLEDDTLSSSPPVTDGDDFIETDYPSSPSHYSPPTPQQVLTIPTKEKPPKQKKKWSVIRKAVAWSPFVQVYRKKYPWVQLAGHQGNFSPGEENGTIIKKSSADEARALKSLMDDVVRPYVPEFRREYTRDAELYIEMADLLRDFDNPSVMDIKMGTRTYLEDELAKARVKEVLRPDMYEKMIAVDPDEPTEQEHAAKAITKPRYMVWRETLSSTATLGFRIEGIKMSKDKPMKEEFKTVRRREDVRQHLKKFVKKQEPKRKILEQLKQMRACIERSDFFKQHEVIGSSLLFVYDSNDQASVHIIDFGKTIPVPSGITLNHKDEWKEGNHEDGYLFGLDNLIEIWETL